VSRALAAIGLLACLVLALQAATAADADVTGRSLRPSLPDDGGVADSAKASERFGKRDISLTAAQGRLVTVATRELDIGKLEPAAFGDGEDVAR